MISLNFRAPYQNARLNGEELMCYTELVTPPVDKYALRVT